MSPTAKVTFTTPINTTDLFPDSPAPYVNGGISLTPQPIITGISETISAKLTNPLTVPITVDVEFGFAQSSIGLTFGPIKDIVGQIIPASSSVSVSAVFTPVVSGHYCVQVSYNITAIGSARLLRPQGGSQLRQFNINPEQGPSMTPNDKDSLDKADKAFKKVEKLSPRGTNIQQGIIDKWWGWTKDTAKKISQALGGDPPRQDYNVSTLPVWHRWPHTQPDANISAARACGHECRQRCISRCGGLRQCGGYGARSVWRRFSGQRSHLGRTAGQCPAVLRTTNGHGVAGVRR